MLKKIVGKRLKRLFSIKTMFILLDVILALSVVVLLLLNNIDSVVKCIIFVVIFMVYEALVTLLEDIIKEKQKELRINKRFTHKNDETGAIEIKKEDFQQAILYLYELENNIANNMSDRE